jgi:two-component system sensor histidine kinase KdpD
MPYVWTVLAISIVTAAGKALQPAFDLVDIALLYLLLVLISAVRWGWRPSLFASLAGMLALDYFFVPPFLSFAVSDVRHVLSFAIFLLVALVTVTLAFRLRSQAEDARERERRMAALYSLSDRMAAETDIRHVLQTAVEAMAQSVDSQVAILMPREPDGLLDVVARSGNANFALGEKERAIAQWVFEQRREAGRGSDALSATEYLFIPMVNGDVCIALLALSLASLEPLSRERRKGLETLMNLTALAINRVQLAFEAEQAKWLAESEKLHRAILNAVSHDLRTPLSSITGAVTGLLAEGDRYDDAARAELLVAIKDGALRMNRFVTNLLDMARLESGILKPNKEWCDMLDIVGVALKEVGDMLPEHALIVKAPDALPLVPADFGLMEQVLINLLENGVKYAPPDSTISIALSRTEDELRVTVADLGPPIPESDRERIFDKFFRLRSSKHVTGSGLGLSICKGIVEAHGGSIWVEPSPNGGNAFTLALPLTKGQPESLPAKKEKNHG